MLLGAFVNPTMRSRLQQMVLRRTPLFLYNTSAQVQMQLHYFVADAEHGKLIIFFEFSVYTIAFSSRVSPLNLQQIYGVFVPTETGIDLEPAAWNRNFPAQVYCA